MYTNTRRFRYTLSIVRYAYSKLNKFRIFLIFRDIFLIYFTKKRSKFVKKSLFSENYYYKKVTHNIKYITISLSFLLLLFSNGYTCSCV